MLLKNKFDLIDLISQLLCAVLWMTELCEISLQAPIGLGAEIAVRFFLAVYVSEWFLCAVYFVFIRTITRFLNWEYFSLL